jgi:hypothetical protein
MGGVIEREREFLELAERYTGAGDAKEGTPDLVGSGEDDAFRSGVRDKPFGGDLRGTCGVRAALQVLEQRQLRIG